MTQRDRWKHRPVVDRYYTYKDELNLKCNAANFKLGSQIDVIAEIAMPKSWSKKKRSTMIGQPHQSRPDIDNIIKGIFDCLLPEDSHVWHVRAKKYWLDQGRLTITNIGG